MVGSFRPHPNLLSAFNGQDAYGDWTLTVIDVESCCVEGSLDAWALRVSEATGPPDGCVYPGDCDTNGTVDLNDSPSFAACLAGPVAGVGANCGCADVDNDNHAGLRDFAWFQAKLGEP